MHRRSLKRLLAVGVAAALALTPVSAGAAPSTAADLADGCDPVDAAACLLPFPSDYYTVADPRTDTGLRINFDRDAMPKNIFGTHINPWEWNRNDGFSPGSMLLTHVPGLDLAATGAAPQTDIGRSLAADAPIVLINTRTGARHPYWAELDARATDPARQALIIRPAVNFDEGTRYVVGLRNLRNAAGTALPPSAAWATVSAPTAPADPALTRRWQYAQRALGSLGSAGIGTAGLYLAWDFTVASQRNLTERILHMRDEAFAKLGPFSPTFTVDSTEEFTAEQNPRIQRRIKGNVLVPSYLNNTLGPPGSWLNYGSNGKPKQLNLNTQIARYICNVPRSASAANPARPALYGHGLLGDPAEIQSSRLEQYALESNTMMCATPWIGMAGEDVPNVVVSVADFSQFPSIPDRTQQGFLNFLFLGRAMIHTWGGFTTKGAFRDAGGKALTRSGSGQLVYLGNSQGGILGGALTAVAKDFTNASLGVPGMNYSTLLNRSVDFNQFLPVFDTAYPDKIDQQLIFGLTQMLWDRGEANGYAHHMTDNPLPNTPRHRVILIEAWGDHQVANIATEVEARTIGARLKTPALGPGRSRDVQPFWGIPPIPAYPYPGSALIVVDSGQPPAPIGNVPPTEGKDPHGHPASSPQIRALVAHFLATGQVIDTCGGGVCTAPAG